MKILSINLWFDKYGHKTLAQLKAFRSFGFETYAATVIEVKRALKCEIYKVDNDITTAASQTLEKEALVPIISGPFDISSTTRPKMILTLFTCEGSCPR